MMTKANTAAAIDALQEEIRIMRAQCDLLAKENADLQARNERLMDCIIDARVNEPVHPAARRRVTTIEQAALAAMLGRAN